VRFSVPTGSWRDCGNDWRQSPTFWLATQISIFWRIGAAIGPRPRPAFVKRNLAVIDALLVFPFLTQPFLASESFRPIRSRDCADGLTGNGLATHLGADIDGSQLGRNQGHCENLIRKKLHNWLPTVIVDQKIMGRVYFARILFFAHRTLATEVPFADITMSETMSATSKIIAHFIASATLAETLARPGSLAGL